MCLVTFVVSSFLSNLITSYAEYHFASLHYTGAMSGAFLGHCIVLARPQVNAPGHTSIQDGKHAYPSLGILIIQVSFPATL